MSGFSWDFNLAHEYIEVKPPATPELVLEAEEALGVLLPPSYKHWLTNIANGAHVELGNALRLFALNDDNPSQLMSVISATLWWREWEVSTLKDVVILGGSGVDFETYAFYTRCRDESGEYPVIWMSPGSADCDGYVLLNSRFDRFLNIEGHMLEASHLHDLDTEDFERLSRDLRRRYDPRISLKNIDHYAAAVTAAEVKKQAAELVKYAG